MSEPLPDIPSTLKELHRLRRHLRNLQEEIDRGPRVLKIRQQNLNTEEQAHRTAHETLKKLKLQQKADEGSLKETEQRLAKLQADIHSAASKKEFDAKTHEIAFTTTRKSELEDSILMAITEIEERTAQLPAVDQKWADVQAEFAAYQKEAQQRLERLLTEQKAMQAELATVEQKLPPDVKPQYDRLIKSHNADALAGVSGRNCEQCRTTITEQTRTKLLSGLFVCCPNCGRGLYLAE
ncbi:MAG: hypothetical protein LC104_20080 [Bacteroidales bacterium]|nr:hypothetical protein [Bacteroidales bacterium]